MSEQKSSPVNEVESGLLSSATVVLERAQAQMNSVMAGILASRGVKSASEARLSDDGKTLTWVEAGGPGNSVEPSSIGLVSDKDDIEGEPEEAAH